MLLAYFLISFLVVCDAKETVELQRGTQFTALKGGEPFKECEDPTVVQRKDDHVHVDLVVDMAKIKFDWLELDRRVYNGKMCGPTIRVRRGDKLSITLTNKLEPNQAPPVKNLFHSPNTTNIHLHGLHLPNLLPGDDIFHTVGPGEAHNYTYDIHPEQPSGSFYYHAHFHGSTWFHVASGLSGAILVEDVMKEMPPELEAVSCPHNCENDIEMLLQPTLQFTPIGFIFIQESIGDYEGFRVDDETKQWLEDPENNIDYYTVNGLLQPTLEIERGKVKRLRILNGGAIDLLELHFVNTKSSEQECQVYEIAFDGIYLDEPRKPKQGQTLVAPGARVDFLIRCDHVGSYELRSTALEINTLSIGKYRRYNATMLTINVIETIPSSDAPTNFPTSLPRRQSFNSDLRNIPQSEIGGRFVLEADSHYNINRDTFNSKADYRYKMEVDTIQEWTIINPNTVTQHPLHIHVNHFQVISYNEYTGPWTESTHPTFILRSQEGKICTKQHSNYSKAGDEDMTSEEAYAMYGKYLGHDKRNTTGGLGTMGYIEEGDWRDVINVPPMSNMTIRFNTHKHVGPVVIHCHVLSHEDLGMMMTVEIVEKGSDLTARIASNGACPGSCDKDDKWIPFPDVCGGGSGIHMASSIVSPIAIFLVWFHRM